MSESSFGYPSASMSDTAQELVAPLSPRSSSVLDMAREEQRVSKQDEVTAEHLLLGILREGGRAAKVLEANGVSEEEARSFVAVASPGSSRAPACGPSSWSCWRLEASSFRR